MSGKPSRYSGQIGVAKISERSKPFCTLKIQSVPTFFHGVIDPLLRRAASPCSCYFDAKYNPLTILVSTGEPKRINPIRESETNR